MYKRIVVGYDGTDGGRDALALGRQLAQRAGAELVVACVVPEAAVRKAAVTAEAGGEGDMWRKLADDVAAAAAELGGESEVAESSSAARGLIELAEELPADAIVVGSNQDEPGTVRAGREALRLLQGAPCAVALAPAGHRDAAGALDSIAVGIDGSPESTAALRAATALADGAPLALLAVAGETSPAMWGYGSWGYALEEVGEAARASARKHLDEALVRAPEGSSAEVLGGEVAAELVARAGDGVDLLCLGSRGYGPVLRVLLGSVSAAVVKHAPCAVLVVPRDAAEVGA